VIGATSVLLGAIITGIFTLHNTASNQITVTATATSNVEINPYPPFTHELRNEM